MIGGRSTEMKTSRKVKEGERERNGLSSFDYSIIVMVVYARLAIFESNCAERERKTRKVYTMSFFATSLNDSECDELSSTNQPLGLIRPVLYLSPLSQDVQIRRTRQEW